MDQALRAVDVLEREEKAAAVDSDHALVRATGIAKSEALAELKDLRRELKALTLLAG